VEHLENDAAIRAVFLCLDEKIFKKRLTDYYMRL